VNSEQDVKNLIDKDSAHSQEQLAAISEQLHELIENREQLEQRILDADARLHKQEKLTALQRKTMTEEREVYRKQMASYECSIFVFQQQQEATRIRQSTINFIKDSPNLIMFYRTIENRLEALFHSILAAQGGYVKRGNSTKQSNMRPTSIPFGKSGSD
jgi:septal ring factor EnvC (AmiA/AmiB activator)